MDFSVQTRLPTNISGVLAGTGESLVKASSSQLALLAGAVIGGAPTANSVMMWDSNSNTMLNNEVALSQGITAAFGSTALTVSSGKIQILTGAANQTIVLPNATTLQIGTSYQIINNCTAGVTTVTNNAGTILIDIISNSQSYGNGSRVFTCTDNSTAAGIWVINDFSVSGRVPLNVDVNINTIKVRMVTTGGVGFNVSSNTGSTITMGFIANTFAGATPTLTAFNGSNVSVLTTPTNVIGATTITNANNTLTVQLQDLTNGRTYELRIILAPTYNAISILQHV